MAAVIDYHVHLWPHGTAASTPTVEELAGFCEAATAAGVTEIALTEHLFRFAQADSVLGGFWNDLPESDLRDHLAAYWSQHARADLDCYVEAVLAAKAAGLPVVLGLEVDHYAGRMDDVAALVGEYPFDVLLGSVHWIGAWGFDNLDDPLVMAEWHRRSVDAVWDAYTEALEELAGARVCDVLAHPDLPKVTGRRPAVPDEWHARMAELAAASGMSAEVSSAGWRKPAAEAYPAPGLLSRFCKAGVPVTTASDAHGTADVGFRAAELRSLLLDAGYGSLVAFDGRRRRSLPLS